MASFGDSDSDTRDSSIMSTRARRPLIDVTRPFPIGASAGDASNDGRVDSFVLVLRTVWRWFCVSASEALTAASLIALWSAAGRPR